MTIDDRFLWERRFRAPDLSLPDWGPLFPDRLVFATTESGVWQVHAWDRALGTRRRVTDYPVGVVTATPSIDGNGVLWFQDETGDESGRWFHQPFHGGQSRPLFDVLPAGWNEGLAQAPGLTAVAVSDRDGFAVYSAVGDEAPKELYRSTESVRLGGSEAPGFNRAGLSADGSMLCLEHSEYGDLIHPALRVIAPRTGETLGELHDPGLALVPACWSPVPGDTRLAVVDERDGEERPALWDLRTGERTKLGIEALHGPVTVHDWWPEGSALLLGNLHDGRDRLYRHDLATGELTSISTPQGTVSQARVRPEGSVWFRHSGGDRQPAVVGDHGRKIIELEGEPTPDGRPFVSWHFDNPHGQQVHGFHVAPEGPGPFPVIMRVHGGPTWLDTDRWSPEIQSYVDAGFAVAMVNYRGSTGYGRAWRDEIIGDIGRPELEDVNAGLADLVSKAIADPDRAVIAGWSWGGYVTLLELGKHPDLWRCGVAGVPVGDYEAGYDDLSPLLQAYDRALLGGRPDEVPDLMRDRNPINFADRVTAPVLILAGENDSRCPIRQVLPYVERLHGRGHPVELYTYRTGHSSFDIEEEIRQQRVILDFLSRQVP